jgi:hypothetical protein
MLQKKKLHVAKATADSWQAAWQCGAYNITQNSSSGYWCVTNTLRRLFVSIYSMIMTNTRALHRHRTKCSYYLVSFANSRTWCHQHLQQTHQLSCCRHDQGQYACCAMA